MEQSKRSTFSILFYLKKKALKKDGTTPIMVRVTVNGEISYLSAKLSIKAELWDQSIGKAIGKSIESQKINQKLDSLKVQLSNKYDAMMHHDSFTTAEKVKNATLGIGVMDNSLMKVYKKHNEDMAKVVGSTMSESNHRKHCIIYDHLAKFMHQKYNRTDIAFQEITEDFLREFDSYFRIDCGLMPNTVWLYMNALSKIMNMAVNKDIILKTPFRNFEAKKEQVHPKNAYLPFQIYMDLYIYDKRILFIFNKNATDPCMIKYKQNKVHPTNAYFLSCMANIFRLKNCESLYPYACLFIVLILLLIPSTFPVEMQ